MRDKDKLMKSLITSIAILGLIGLVVGVTVQAATEASVGATVTVQNVSVTVDDGAVTYGTLGAGASEDTTSSGVDNTQIATNDGNVIEDFNIRGTDSANWALGASVGSDIYVHEFCKVDTGDCDGTPTWTALTTGNQTLKASVAKDGTYDFDLQITTPSPSTSYAEQSVNVTIQAVAS